GAPQGQGDRAYGESSLTSRRITALSMGALSAAGLCATTLLMSAGCAGTPASSPPDAATAAHAAAPPRTERGLAPPVRGVLPNGLRLIVQDHRASEIVAIYMVIGTGVRYEKPDELGSAHFQEHMLFKGTDKFGPGYIDRFVEGMGGRSNAVTSFDYTMFYL